MCQIHDVKHNIINNTYSNNNNVLVNQNYIENYHPFNIRYPFF